MRICEGIGVLELGSGCAAGALGGILAALIARETTGRGQRVDASLVQGLNPLDYFGVAHWQLAQRTGQAPSIGPAAALGASRYFLMHCTRDGRFLITCPQLPHQTRALLRALGLEHTLDDPRFAGASRFASARDAQAWEDLLWE